jgi:hypothetical protein
MKVRVRKFLQSPGSRFRSIGAGGVLAVLLLAAGPAAAFTITFSAADFGVSPTFSNVQNFEFSIEVLGPLAPGVYADPVLVGVEYSVYGSLDTTPPSKSKPVTGPRVCWEQGRSCSPRTRPAADTSAARSQGSRAARC